MSQAELLKNSQKNPQRATVQVVTTIPKWMSEGVALSVRERMKSGKVKFKFSFSKGERKTMRRRKFIPISIWAERHRNLENSSIRGKWKNIFTPYLVGVMDAASTSGVETVILCKSPQTGGSEAGHNLVGWCIDRAHGPVMYVFPDEITARENAKDRIIPMINSSPRLREYMTGYADDASSLRINLMHMPIHLGWSGSVSRLGNKPVRTLILDELDKYKDPKNEATSEALAEKRTTTWRNRRKIFKISTPTTEDGPIWQAFTKEAGARFDYYVKCPHCGVMQLMDFESITWDDKDTDKEPTSEDVLTRRLAYYPCNMCGAVWDDVDRDAAVRKGEWRERTSALDLISHLAVHTPVKVGFHIPAWISYFVSLSEVAAAALKYKESGKIEDLKNLQNQYKAEPWQEEIIERSEDVILALCDDRPRGAVPSPVDGKARIACLLAGIDTQGANEIKGHFRYVIRAFGFGDAEETWLVQQGIAPSFTALNELLWKSVYRDASGIEYKVRAAMIDAMGLRTKEVYKWATKHRGRVFPWQGVRSLSQPYTPSLIEYYPDAKGNKIKIPGGVTLWRCDDTFFKSDLSHKVNIAPDDPGAFHLHSNEQGELNQYAKEMCVEVWDDEKMAWINPKSKANHAWDCEKMVLALAYILNIRHKKKPDSEDANMEKRINQVRTSQRAMSVSERLSRARR